jgi:glucoamylase
MGACIIYGDDGCIWWLGESSIVKPCMSETVRYIGVEDAPGAPGIFPNWCNGNKQAVGTTLGPSRVWFTIGQGILNEVYYPRIDIPQIRDLGFIVSDGKEFWVEIKRLEQCVVEYESAGIPAVKIIHTHPRFTFTQRIVPEPNRDVILIEISLTGSSSLHPYVLLAPHLGGTGYDNTAEVVNYRNRKMLRAEQGPFGLALVAVNKNQQDAFDKCSAGYSGTSDGWQDFNKNDSMQWQYRQAGPGNVALTASLPKQATLALGFATSADAAATLAVSALLQPFEVVWQQQIDHWRTWHNHCHPLDKIDKNKSLSDDLYQQIKTSAMVLRTHQDQTFRGALVASLSIPWGEIGEERPGYHLVWPRDLVESAGALLALGSEIEAREILRYLIATQLEDGSWYQNQWLGGTPYWTGVQLDQIAFPVLLAGTLADRGALNGINVTDMVTRALSFIAINGPASPQDRWEENSGINTFTLSVCIAALVSGAQFLQISAEAFVLELADYWNERLESWTTVSTTELAKRFGVSGYYIRVTPLSTFSDDASLSRIQPIKNRKQDPELTIAEQVGVDFLQLVRYGLRDPNEPMIRDTLTLVDGMLRVELPQGPCWYRYTGDGYGEHSGGEPFDGTGQGRVWPLLTGERGHYELVKGNDALPYLRTMAAMTGGAGMFPEQVWDSPDLAKYKLYRGKPTGSAMPLAWAHAEFIKLAYSILEEYPIDRPEMVWARYRGHKPQIYIWYWSLQMPFKSLPAELRLGFCLPYPATVIWKVDDEKYQETLTSCPIPGVNIAHLQKFPAGIKRVLFRIVGNGWYKDKEYLLRII